MPLRGTHHRAIVILGIDRLNRAARARLFTYCAISHRRPGKANRGSRCRTSGLSSGSILTCRGGVPECSGITERGGISLCRRRTRRICASSVCQQTVSRA